MEDSSPAGEVTVALYRRSDLPGPSESRAEAVASELERLAADGTVAAVDVQTWPKRVPVDDCQSGVRDVYLEWLDWARSADVRLQPFFDTRECYCPETEDYTDWLVVPAMAIAVAVDGDLAAVYPHEDGAETVSVEDGIDALTAAGRTGPDRTIGVAD